jgi:serine/threonine protein kinase/Tol biopolymer transport system component
MGLAVLQPGTRIGLFEVLGPLGVGGMGEVYRARDARLQRDVAIKVLPEELTHDPDRRARFEREARLLATLNHPHIASIYGLEDAGGQVALVLELVDGPTLADRLAGGALSPDESLRIARQIAGALEAAHEKRIIHRDLKPENIKLTPGGGVKLLDFGIAKALAPDDPGDASQAATATANTRDGTIVGTAAYMSPEQARGQQVDKRTDIWAFGCVLYEMLSGRRAFGGPTLSDTFAALLEREPDWTALPAGTAVHIRRVLRRCLEKDPGRRFRDIGDVALELTDPAPEPGPVPVPRAPWWQSRIVLTFGALGLVALTAYTTGALVRRSSVSSVSAAAPIRFTIPPPSGWRFGSQLPDVETTYLALSPDGSQLAFVATEQRGTSRLWIRPLSAVEARPLDGTDGVISAFWSPDGRSLAFFAGGKLKRLDLPDGAPVTVAEIPYTGGLSGSWGEDGRLIYAELRSSEIFRVSTAAEPPSSLVKTDPAQDEVRLYWPWWLPGGQRLLYVAITDGGSSILKMLESGEAPRSIMRVGSNVQWVDPDYLVFAREGTLLAQRFDPSGGRPVGEPVAIADPVDYAYVPPRAAFATSRTGTLVYQSHRDVAELAWFDRSGKQVGTVREPATYYTLRLSSDGTRLMFTLRDRRQGTQDVWMRDLERGIETPLSSDPRPELPGPWLPDRRLIVFSALRSGTLEMFLKNLVTGDERRLLSGGPFQLAGDVTPDGTHLIYAQRTDDWDIWMLPLDRPAEAAPLLNRSFAETDPRLSPDGRALAFVANESKRSNVYVTAFPVTGPRVQASTEGGTQPRWGPGGDLFFVSGQGQLMTVPVRTAPSLDVGKPRPVFPLPDRGWADFAVAPDGRFLAVVPEITAREQPVTVIVNWPAAIKR